MAHSASLRPPHEGLPATVHADDKGAHVGGEGTVYFSVDGRYALKVFHKPQSEFDQHMRHVMDHFGRLSDDHKRFILPPLALLDSFDDQPCQGFIMRRVPPRYLEAVGLILSPVEAAVQFKLGLTWANYLKAARSMTNAIVVLHLQGCGHSDIHFRNFLVDINEGEAVMMEADGIVIAGYKKARVQGFRGFTAPEILTNGAEPSPRTDLHSLAVLILHTLLFRNPLEPQIEYANNPEDSEKIGWGSQALFSEHPHDSRHTPTHLGFPLYRGGALSYRMLTPQLRQLSEQALITALHDPSHRPAARQWRDALAACIDVIWTCQRCRQHFPYPHWLSPPARRGCPFCGQRCQPPYAAVLSLYEERRTGAFSSIHRDLVLGHGFNLYEDIAEPGRPPPWTRRSTPSIGHAEWDPARGVFHLVNDSDTAWTSIVNHASSARASQFSTSRRTAITRGQSTPLEPGRWIRLGQRHRAMIVADAGGMDSL